LTNVRRKYRLENVFSGFKVAHRQSSDSATVPGTHPCDEAVSVWLWRR
jgi:hypothetical protein